MAARSDPSNLHPDWTEEEMSMLIEAWKEVETKAKGFHPTRNKVSGGFDHRIVQLLPQRFSKRRTACAISVQRYKLYEAIRSINHFDEKQQSAGGQLWFNLSKEERSNSMPVRIRKTGNILTQESYNTLVKLKSVRKWTKVRRVIKPKPKPSLTYVRPQKSCHSCWSAPEVRALVRSWSRVLKTSGTSVQAFDSQSDFDSATAYTPWNHSTFSAWRKMKRLVASYLFIQDFNGRHSPAKWFQLSDGTQDAWLDWGALPTDFEDISKDIFDEIHSIESPTRGQNDSPEGNVEAKEDQKTPKLHAQSPHLPDSNPFEVPKSGKQVRDNHGECNSFYEQMERLQEKQFNQDIQRLRTEIQRDIRRSTDMVRAIFFERLGDPKEDGDASFVENLLNDQQRQVGDQFVQFQREHISESKYVYDSGSEG
ncbi:hypothetical protein V7S43_013301 [Phytophthora oleae]|uniref:Myb-like domain-containing protein n=1 Tax=Phytophthora oleae TaxID=2107226 RepID=A0ABD3F793_9STRA